MPRTAKDSSVARCQNGNGDTLSLRALNRATLERQMLLRRWQTPMLDAIEQLVGLQAQTPHSWYHGLWTRLEDFQPERLAEMLVNRQVARIALMRSTIHLVTARDCLWLRPITQPVIERSTKGSFGRHWIGLDTAAVAAAGRALVEEKPRTFSELGNLLAERWPDRPPAALAQAIRAWVALVQIPPRGVWGMSGPAAHTTVEAWLGGPLATNPSPEDLILRYLGAFGPATVKDMQTWSGLTRLSEITDRLRPRLASFRDQQGRELFDLPDAPRPDPGISAPPRFLYDYDNLLLSHADRSRFITEEYHKQGFTMDGPMPCIALVDGFTNATWKIIRNRNTAILTIKPFTRLSRKEIAALTEEGARLLAFAAADAGAHDIRFIPCG
jgi:Winged helix DNA-binding domain